MLSSMLVIVFGFIVLEASGNSKNNNCGPAQLTAEDSLKYIQVPVASSCSWSLWAIRNESVLIYMKRNKTSQETNQCVNVTYAEGQYSDIICTPRGDVIDSDKQPFVITYTPPKTVSNNSGTFHVYYRMKNCGQYRLSASYEEQMFPIFAAPTDIPERHTCTWIIATNNKTPFEIKVERSQTPNQCVEVFCTKFDIICGDSVENVVECSEETARITFPVSGYPRTTKNFKVIYKSAAEKSPGAQNCDNVQLISGSKKHTFIVMNESEIITQGYQCTWSIDDLSDKPIRISLETLGTDTENQCVTVKCSGDQMDHEICALAGTNSFTCTTKPAFVIFSAGSSMEDVKNIQVTYQLDSAKANSSTLAVLVIIILFSQTQ